MGQEAIVSTCPFYGNSMTVSNILPFKLGLICAGGLGRGKESSLV